MNGQYRDIVVFTTLYLFFSLPPFLVFNQSVLAEIRTRLAPLDVVVVAVAGTAGLDFLPALVLARDSNDRYNRFLAAPTDLLSVLVALSFLFAATAWWAVPELAVRTTASPELRLVLAAIILCHVPMVLFLSLMTIVGYQSN